MMDDLGRLEEQLPPMVDRAEVVRLVGAAYAKASAEFEQKLRQYLERTKAGGAA